MKGVFSGVLVAVGLAVAAWAGPFVHGPYAGAPAADSVTISWTAAPLPARVEYCPYDRFVALGTLDQSVSHTSPGQEDRETVHIRLVGLAPGTRYAYQVVLVDGEAEHESPLGTFYTAPQPGTPVAFAVLSDTQWQWTGTNRIALVGDAIAADPTPFQFILHAGDIVESPVRHFWDHTFSSLSTALLRAPFLPVLGNHERNHSSYYQAFALPPGGGQKGEQWWVLRWGDVVVVGLDSNVRRPGEFTAQAEWVRTPLAGPEPHKFVIFHFPVFASDLLYGPGMEGLQKLWHPVFVEVGVDIVFSGHAHNYERIERDGVAYLIVGGGGATLRPLAEERLEGSQVACDKHHFYARVMTGPDGIRVEVVAVARQVDGDVVPATGLLDAFTHPWDR